MALEGAKLIDEEYERTTNKTWATGFEIDGVSYATSLFWQPLQNVDDPFADVEQASQGVLEGADLFCIKAGKAPQFGICVSHEGFSKGQTVAAVALSSSMSNVTSFVGVFKVQGGWWYVCIRNDIILSDGDMLFLQEDDAKNQFESMLAVPDWSIRIAPTEWGFESTEEIDLAPLLIKGQKAKLQKIKALRGTKLIAVFAISGILGFWILYSLFDAIFLAPPKRPVIVPVAPKVMRPIEKPKEAEIKPWERLPEANKTMIDCYDGTIKLMSIMPPGWVMSNVICASNMISTSWAKDVGRVAWMKKALEQSKISFASTSFAGDGRQAQASISFGKQVLKSTPPTKTASNLTFEINNLFQSLGVVVTLGEQKYTDTDKKIYNMITFKFVSPQNPLAWRKILTKFSGLVINNITYSPGAKTWSYEGAIYVL